MGKRIENFIQNLIAWIMIAAVIAIVLLLLAWFGLYIFDACRELYSGQ